jgi:ribose transport system substrate-binding protein
MLALMVAACAPRGRPAPAPAAQPDATLPPPAAPTPAPVAVQYAVIGKARGDYWERVERGTQAAAQQLGLPAGSVVFYAPEQEDPAAQILAVERFVAQKVRGIALAPSNPRALDLTIRRAREAGVWLITFDSDAPETQRLFFVGTSQHTIGREAGAALLRLMGERGGKAAVGSTLLDDAARERLTAFKEALGAGRPNSKWTVLDPVNDRHDAAQAAQAAKNSLSANKDLAAAFGLYAYNNLAWCRAVRDAQAAARLTVVGFDLDAESVACLKDGALDAVVVPWPFEQGLQSVLALDGLAHHGLVETAAALHIDTLSAAPDWMVDIGVDVVSLQGAAGMSLAEYAAKLDGEHAARDWQP